MRILTLSANRDSSISSVLRYSLLAVLCQFSIEALAEPQWNESSAKSIDASLSGLMQESGVVGMALGIVLGQELIFASGYGL